MHPKPKNTSAIESSGPYAKPLDLDNHVPGLLVWVNNKFSADASRAYRKMFGVGLADWRIVAYLGVKEHGTAAQIGEFLGMDKAAVSRSVKFLKLKGYLDAQEPEGRRISLSLTGQGIELYNAVLDVALLRAEALMSGFEPEERTLLIKLLHRMHNNIPAVVKATDEIISQRQSTD